MQFVKWMHLLISKIRRRKKDMNEIWANRLAAGEKSWEEVPLLRKNSVRSVLQKRVENKIITELQYKEITGEVYEG